MVDSKKIGIAGAAVVLVTLVTIFGTSYMADFENNPRNVSQNDSQETFEYIALGSETATVTIIEIGDYQCEMCKRWFDTARPQIIENYVITGDVNLIFIDMPFLGNDSQHASAATYCADDQGKYWGYHEKLYQLQGHENDGWANADRLSAIAFGLDMDMELFDACMKSKSHYDRVAFNNQKARNDFGANSTPTFIIFNSSGASERLVGAYPYSAFEDIINSML